MTDKQLVAQLRKLKVNTKSLACLGCGYEHDCGIHGCHLIGMAADTIAKHDAALETIKAKHTAASGVGKSLLRYVLSILDPAYGVPPEIHHNVVHAQQNNCRPDVVDAIQYALESIHTIAYVHDFELCDNGSELIRTMRYIDDHGYTMVSATQDASGVYTVFFRRPAQD